MTRNIFKNIAIFIIFLITTSCVETDIDEQDNITKYLGTWNVSDQSARINYTVTIEANPSNSAEILINNFADLGTKAYVLVVGNSLVIDSQPLVSDYTVSGSGSYLTSGKLQIDFNLNDGIDNEARIAVLTK